MESIWNLQQFFKIPCKVTKFSDMLNVAILCDKISVTKLVNTKFSDSINVSIDVINWPCILQV